MLEKGWKLEPGSLGRRGGWGQAGCGLGYQDAEMGPRLAPRVESQGRYLLGGVTWSGFLGWSLYLKHWGREEGGRRKNQRDRLQRSK